MRTYLEQISNIQSPVNDAESCELELLLEELMLSKELPEAVSLAYLCDCAERIRLHISAVYEQMAGMNSLRGYYHIKMLTESQPLLQTARASKTNNNESTQAALSAQKDELLAQDELAIRQNNQCFGVKLSWSLYGIKGLLLSPQENANAIVGSTYETAYAFPSTTHQRNEITWMKERLLWLCSQYEEHSEPLLQNVQECPTQAELAYNIREPDITSIVMLNRLTATKDGN